MPDPTPLDPARPETDPAAARYAIARLRAERDAYREALGRVRKALDEMATWCGPFGYPGVPEFIDRRDAHLRAALDGTAP